MVVFSKQDRGPYLPDGALRFPLVAATRQGQSITQRTSNHNRVEDYPTNFAYNNIDSKLQEAVLPSNAQRELLSWLLIK